MPINIIIGQTYYIIPRIPCFRAIVIIIGSSFVPESSEKEEMLNSECEYDESECHACKRRSDNIGVNKTEP